MMTIVIIIILTLQPQKQQIGILGSSIHCKHHKPVSSCSFGTSDLILLRLLLEFSSISSNFFL